MKLSKGALISSAGGRVNIDRSTSVAHRVTDVRFSVWFGVLELWDVELRIGFESLFRCRPRDLFEYQP
jgi:hypothetical protein